MKVQSVGSWAFIAGVILAIILGIFGQMVATYKGYIVTILVVIGLIVGFINIGDKETANFLIAAIALLAANTATQWTSLDIVGTISTYIAGILGGIAIFVAPAAVLVALKAIYDMAYKK
jgi:hypothetical protein